MNRSLERQVIAFAGARRVAAGPLREVALRLKELINKGETHLGALVFDAASSEPVELDLRGTAEDVLQRLAKAESARVMMRPPRAPRGVPGWEWLRAR